MTTTQPLHYRVDTEAALEVIRDAGAWLWANGLTSSKWWHPDSLTLNNLAPYARPEHFYAGFVDDTPAVAAVLQTSDSFGDWSEVDAEHPPSALYVHWLSVGRAFAGQSLSDGMLTFAIELAKQTGRTCVRLDTNANNKKLCAIYERNGFKIVRVLPGEHSAVALYQSDL